jgi:serine/threonine-protein phosphatase 2A activator
MDLLLNLLDQIDAITDTVPVREARNRRFGDAAFRDWLTALEDMVSHSAEPNALKQMLPKALHPAISELASYLLSSFGDKQRLDYGTGHELSFLSFLCSLSLLGFLTKHDDRAAVLFAFTRYLDIVRRLQRKYFLEPAGSHGVWGLDDHQFLPYLFGSSQLASERKLPPRSATDAKTSEKWADEYLYLAAIHNIHTVKRGPFAEHSPLLNDISGLQDWTRVNSGLLRMWCGEVLGKRVVVQHLGFGGVLPWRVADGAEEAEK